MAALTMLQDCRNVVGMHMNCCVWGYAGVTCKGFEELMPVSAACCCPCYRHEYPQWRPQDLSRVFPTLEESGLELLRAMLQYDPARRISVSHPASSMCSMACL